jgi:phosphatidylserine/phosphatidylglycerophosphate/cardiolipin synthase-like enzyme
MKRKYQQDNRLEMYKSQTPNVSLSLTSCQTEIVFRYHQRRLCELINNHKTGFIVAAMAWLTDIVILNALNKAAARGIEVEILLQKESFLKRSSKKCKKEIVDCYYSIMNFQKSAVRSIGDANKSSHPLMHHKFVVFGCIKPAYVWTGSYNCSKTAEQSFENAVILHSTSIAEAYMNEFRNLFRLSEPLNWKTKVMTPQNFKSSV